MTLALGPILNEDLFVYTMSNFVKPKDIFNCACVCKLWNQFAESSTIWKSHFTSQGIPMVSPAGEARNYRSDFRVLYPVTTVSGEAIRRTLGEPIGNVPCVTVEFFDRLSQPDLFDPAKFQKETFELVVEYPFIERVLGTNECPLALDECGNLVEVPPSDGTEVDDAAQTPTRIPFTLRNRITLAKYPLMGKEHMPVFSYVSDLALMQNDYCPLNVNVYYQTRRIVDGTRNLPYSEKKAFVEAKGLSVMPLGSRVLSNIVQIIFSGICPDDKTSYARTSSLFYLGGDVYQTALGGFEPVLGMYVMDFIQCEKNDKVGVVAGGPAEAVVS